MINKDGTIVVGVVGKSGRKSKAKELEIALERMKEEVTTEALIKLANSKVMQFLDGATSFQEVRDLGLPITLKGITEKKDITTNGKELNTTSYEQALNIIRERKGSDKSDSPERVDSV